jgi:hypothetical protein
VSIFWLSKDNEGQGIVIRGSGADIKRISTHAIEAAIQSYSRIDDAIGYCFQQQGHAFYVLTFPTADVSWAFELKSEQWHELAWTDANGGMHRHRANCCAFAYGTNVIGDWQNGNLYALDPNVYTDNGQPIIRIRTFPHLLNDGKRVSYVKFIADMEVGTSRRNRHRRAAISTSDFNVDFGPFIDTRRRSRCGGATRAGRATGTRSSGRSGRAGSTRQARLVGAWDGPGPGV